MDDITNIQEDNLGGLLLIKFAPLRFFASLNPVAFNSGCDWINIYCTAETMQFMEKAVNDDNIGYHQVTITGQVPKIRADIHATLQKYRLQQAIVQCEDNNGFLRQAGTLDNGLILVDQSATGVQVADANGYTFQFTGNQLETAPFL